MDDSLKASPEGLKIVKDAGRKKGWTQTVTQEWWMRANTSQATLKRFWRRLPIDGSAFRGICEAVGVDWRKVVEPGEIAESPTVDTPRENSAIAIVTTPQVLNSNFVGREEALADLNTKIRQGAKVIVIQAPGGVGKTTLAQEFLSSLGFEVGLELLMAKEEANITPVESVVEEWLKRDFGEEPGRDFGVMLGRLKRQLQTKRVGVLIDNLEPALDGQGRFIAPHRRYVELLRVLADASVKSLTLITSREPLAEGLSIYSYSLPSLGEEAWANFFGSRGLEVEATILKEIHKAYGGNALAMTILCDPIQRDGGMGAYWQEQKIEAGLLVELAVENLVKEQFNRLEKISPEAYRLLCRLGCYRYQDVPTVPTDGLFCLLWDVPEERRRQVIKFLHSWSLVEHDNEEFWLHPIIREQAIGRLRASEDWKITNRQVIFWTENIKTVETINDAYRAFEAYYHCLNINELELAVELITKERDNYIEKGERLSDSLYRLGIFNKITLAAEYLISRINSNYYLSIIYNLKGDNLGNVKLSNHIKDHAICKELSEKCLLTEASYRETGLNNNKITHLQKLRIYSVFNIGHLKIYLGEIEEALIYFKEVDTLLKTTNIECQTHPWYFLAFIYSHLGNYTLAYYYIQQTYTNFNKISSYAWSRGYSLYILAQTYNILADYQNSFEMYCQALSYSEEINFTELQGVSLFGLGELYRRKLDFEKAFSYCREAIKLLERIGNKRDLAEAYYQLALTHQVMGEPVQSQVYFIKAIQLYEEMEAPKQVEKVRRAIPLNPP